MPRKPRKKSKTGIYHVIVRGIGQQDIFHEEDDFLRYLETVTFLDTRLILSIVNNEKRKRSI